MLNKQNKKKIGILIFVVMFGLSILGVRACQKSKGYDENCRSIAKDYDGEMQVLLSKGINVKYKSESAIKEMLNEIHDFKSRYDDLEVEAKLYSDKLLYNRILRLEKKLNEKLDEYKNSEDDWIKLDLEVDRMSEDIDVMANVEKIEDIIKRFYELPEDRRYLFPSFKKFTNIENRYYAAVAAQVDEMISELGEVERTSAYKKQLDDIGNAYNKLNYKAKLKVKKYSEYIKKCTEYMKFKLGDDLGGSNEKNN